MVRDRADPVRGHDPRAARLPRARALPLHDRARRPGAAAAAARAGHRPAGQRRLPRRQDRADLVPAGRVRQDRDRHLPRRLPARHAPGARAGLAALPRRHDPAAQALRAAARGLGRGDADARLHPRPRLVADVLRRLPGAALRGHEPALVRGRRDWSLFAAGRVVLRHARSATSRTASTSGSTRSPDYNGAGYQIANGLFAQADGGLFGSGLGRRAPEPARAAGR